MRPPTDISSNPRALCIGTSLNAVTFALVSIVNAITGGELLYMIALPAITLLETVAAVIACRGRVRLSIFLSTVIGGLFAMAITLYRVATGPYPIQTAMDLIVVGLFFLVVAGLIVVHRSEIVLLSVTFSIAVWLAFHVFQPEGNAAEVRITAMAGWAVVIMAVVISNILFSVRKRIYHTETMRHRFIASVNHEIRNPLTALYGYIQMIDQSPEKVIVRSEFRHVRASVEHLRLLLETLLELYTLETGIGDKNCRLRHIGSLVNRLEHNAAILAGATGIIVDTNCTCPSDSTIWGNEKALMVALTAASIGMLRQFRENETFHILVRCEHGNAHLMLGTSDGVAAAATLPAVSNSGIEQIDSERSAITYAVAALLSKLGVSFFQTDSENLTFWSIRIPLVADPDPLSEETVIVPAPTAPVQKNHSVILGVEDDLSIRELLKTALTIRGGWTLETSSSGEEALEMIEDIEPSLILMDIGLPGMDGIETTRELRMNSRMAGVPVVAVTAAVDRLPAALRDPALFQSVVTKPFDIDLLLGTIQSLLEPLDEY